MVEQEIAINNWNNWWKIETSFEYDFCGSIYSLIPLSYTYTFSFPVFYLVLMAGDQFETRNTKRKPRET